MNSVFPLLKCQGEAYIYLPNFPKLLLLKVPYWLRILLINSKSETTDQQVHRFWLQAVVLKTSKMSKLKISLSCWRETSNHQIIETTHPRISKDPSKMRGLKTRTSQGSGMISSGHQWLEIPWFLGNTKKIHSTKTMSSETVHKRQPPMAVAWCETKDIAWRCWIPPGWCNLARLEVSSELFGAWKGGKNWVLLS